MISIKEMYNTDEYDKYNFMAFTLLPNNINILTINNLQLDFVENYINQFKIFIFPVYKNYWRYVNICEKDNFFYLGFGDKKSINTIFKYLHNKKTYEQEYINIYNTNGQLIKKISYEVYAYMNIYIRDNFCIDNLELYEVYGIVKSAEKLNLITTSKNIIIKHKLHISENKFSTIKLKSLNPAIQLYCFDIWINQLDMTISGGTGIGKTSQIPKIFLRYNTFFDGYEAFDIYNYKKNDFLNFNFSRNITLRNCLLSMPRKTIIRSTGNSMAKSLNMDIRNSSISLKYKNIQNEINYYNPMTNNFACYLIISVNRLSLSYLTKNKINSFIIDEIHEHDQFADICISVLNVKKKKLNIRNIILMSATLSHDKENINKFFKNNIRHLYIEGERLFKVTVINDYIDKNIELYEIINKYTPDIGCSMLIFNESISKVNNEYVKLYKYYKLNKKFKFYILHGQIPNSNEIIKKIENNKKDINIILCTNFLESSITISNATHVIDNGKMYLKKFLHGEIIYITKSMAEQRMGRLGRVRSGIYIPLYNESKLNKNFKNINYQYLYNYLIFFKYYDLDIYKDFYIFPDDLTRIDSTIQYLIRKNININKNIDTIFKIFSTYECNMIEYIYLYMTLNTNKQLLNELEKWDMGLINKISNDLKKKLINLNIICKVIKIKKNNNIYTLSLLIVNSPEKNDTINIYIKKYEKLNFYLLRTHPIVIV